MENIENKIDNVEEVVEKITSSDRKEEVYFENDILKVVNYEGISKKGKPYSLLTIYIKTNLGGSLNVPLFPKDDLSSGVLKLYFQSLKK